MKKLISSILVFIPMALAQPVSNYHYNDSDLNCKECHDCNNPTYKKPCLSLFPDFLRDGVTVNQTAEDAPEIIVIDKMMDQFEPSVFTHKLHAEMAAMSGGCESCHHHNPPGKILACSACHESGQRSELNRLGLKGAYHRQCLNCHREWSHQTNCTVCHENRGEKTEDKTKYLGKSHEKMVIPQKVIYETPEADDPLVTFFHEDHAETFGLKCASCHANESCSRCHDETSAATVEECEIHDNCIQCHETDADDQCGTCHDTKEKAPFSHAEKGWELDRFHLDLTCISCHKKQEFKKLSVQCIDCHKEWKEGKFDHSVTGLELDEDHIENLCTDCHAQLDFTKPPFCTECHDDLTYPGAIPGTLHKRK